VLHSYLSVIKEGVLTKQTNNYRHFIPALDLSIERNTGRVPADSKFHMVHKGSVIASYKTKKQAEEKFYQIVKESGYKPEPIPGNLIKADESNERYLRSKDLFWAEGPKYKSKGGPGR